MSPTLIASYAVYANAQNTNTLTTPSFTPANGEVLIVKLATWSTTTSMSAPTGGGQTYQSAVIAAPGGFNPWAGIYFATVSGSPGSMTVSSTPSASSWHSMVVERWGTATMDATPAVNSTISGVGAPSVTVTTTADNSVISTVSGDAQSNDPTGHAYLSAATEDGFSDGHVGSNGVTYYYYQSCGAAGAQTVGMSTPTGQKWALAAVEIKNGATPLTLTDSPVPGARAGTTTDTVAAGVTLADTATGSRLGDTIDQVAVGATLADTPTPGARTGGTSDQVQIGVTLADTTPAARAADTTDQLAIGITLTDSAAAIRAGNTTDALTGAVVGTGADFDIGALSAAWTAGALSTGWSASQLVPASWSAGALEV